MKGGLRSYHLAWLEANPSVGMLQLIEWLKAGFDIHHLDGNHSNDHESNLVLIWGGDHMMLHNGKKRMSRVDNKARPKVILNFPCGCVSVGKLLTTCGGDVIKVKSNVPVRRMVSVVHDAARMP